MDELELHESIKFFFPILFFVLLPIDGFVAILAINTSVYLKYSCCALCTSVYLKYSVIFYHNNTST